MKRILGPLLAGSFLLACGVGDETPPMGDDEDERILCEATFAMTGTFTSATTLDPAGGCQPIGTWNVNVALADQGNCSGAVPFKPNYQYTVSRRTADPNDPDAVGDITYGGPTGDETDLQISAGGGGQCDAKFTHMNPNGAMVNELALRPWTDEPLSGGTTLPIKGEGTYKLWKEHP
ncbi:MAG: hypothetical protein WKG01_26590 [Kofleriaceae bacterium]